MPARNAKTLTESASLRRSDEELRIYGFGGLSEANAIRVLDLLYSNDNGAGMTILHNGMGSSITNPYDLMRSIEPISPGSLNAKPHYDWQGTVKPGFGLDDGQFRLAKDALARVVQKTHPDVWSAPGFMKHKSDDSYGGYLGEVTGIRCATGDWRQAYAKYFGEYLKLYRQEVIDINYVVILNEPDLKLVKSPSGSMLSAPLTCESSVSYVSMLSNGRQAASFLEVLYPTVQKSGLKTEITCCDASGWEQHVSV